MKQKIALLIIVGFYVLIGIAGAVALVFMYPQHTYEAHGEIYKVDFEGSYTLVITDDGNIWGWEGYEVPVEGTRLVLTMSDLGTPDNIYDDVIISMTRE